MGRNSRAKRGRPSRLQRARSSGLASRASRSPGARVARVAVDDETWSAFRELCGETPASVRLGELVTAEVDRAERDEPVGADPVTALREIREHAACSTPTSARRSLDNHPRRDRGRRFWPGEDAQRLYVQDSMERLDTALLTPSDVARLGVSRSWLYAAAKAGRVPCVPARRRRRTAAVRRGGPRRLAGRRAAGRRRTARSGRRPYGGHSIAAQELAKGGGNAGADTMQLAWPVADHAVGNARDA